MVTQTEHNNLWPPFYCAQSILFTVVIFDTCFSFSRAQVLLCRFSIFVVCFGSTNAFCIYSNSEMTSIQSNVDLINPSVSNFYRVTTFETLSSRSQFSTIVVENTSTEYCNDLLLFGHQHCERNKYCDRPINESL